MVELAALSSRSGRAMATFNTFMFHTEIQRVSRGDDKCYVYFSDNSLLCPIMKKLKSVKSWWSCSKKLETTLFWNTHSVVHWRAWIRESNWRLMTLSGRSTWYKSLRRYEFWLHTTASCTGNRAECSWHTETYLSIADGDLAWRRDWLVHYGLWAGGVFMTTCDIEILYFPFDMQACQIELGTYSHPHTHTHRQTKRERDRQTDRQVTQLVTQSLSALCDFA